MATKPATVVANYYDAELGKITDQDREYAKDLIEDYEEDKEHGIGVATVAEWLRKVRYEAVMADRKARTE